MTRLKVLPPGLVSFLAGIITLAGVIWLSEFESQVLLVVACKVAGCALSAYVYYLHKRPIMRGHISIQLGAIFLGLLFWSAATHPHPLYPIILGVLALIALVPDLLVCVIYAGQFSERFTATTPNEWSENK